MLHRSPDVPQAYPGDNLPVYPALNRVPAAVGVMLTGGTGRQLPGTHVPLAGACRAGGAHGPAPCHGAGCLVPARSCLDGALALCFAVVAVVDMETLQLSAHRVPGGGGAHSLCGEGEAGAGVWEHKSRAVTSSQHGRSQGQGQQDH